MGSSCEGDIDCSVGTIVWVRRRNGSWWPGKILGPDELLSSHVMSPRSGTPVKLLGREDASVDWYNLEKSKRVKAFRCGDFDDCIERAESSLGGPSKKREKYARREDAILHALELEKQLLGKKHGHLASTSDANKEDMVTSSESLENETRNHGNSKSNHASKRRDSCLKDDVISSGQVTRESEVGNQVSCEDEILNVMPRMRGLQDFAFKSDPSYQNSLTVLSNSCQKSTEDNPVGGFNNASPSHANSSNCLDKRKALHKGLNAESPAKRRDRRRPLVQVLQSSAKFAHSMKTDTTSVSESGDAQTGISFRAKRSRCVYFPLDSSDCLDHKEISTFDVDVSPSPVDVNNTHPPCSSTEESSSESTDNESDSSKTDYPESNTEEDVFAASDSAGQHEPQDQRMMGRSAMEVEHECVSSDGGGEKAVVGDISHLHLHSSTVPASVGNIYEWHLKGKRNIRNFTKKSLDSSDGDGSTEKGNAKNVRLGFCSRTDDFIESDLNNSQIAPKRRSDWDEFGLRSYYDSGFDGRGHFGGRMNSILVDVDLKVQASYRKEHVPIVSLMSRLNGKAIIGHPVQIEPLQENFLISANDKFAHVENDGNTPLTPVWRTARRTANRVPRPCPSSIWDTEGHQPKKPQFKRPNSGTCQKATRRTPKKVGSVSNQKVRTRTLSSIAVEQKDTAKHNMDKAGPRVCGPTTVACIPVKLVFSRLFEGVVRPPLSKGSGSGSGFGSGSSNGRNSQDCL